MVEDALPSTPRIVARRAPGADVVATRALSGAACACQLAPAHWSFVRLQGLPLRDEAMAPESSEDWRWKARRALSRFGPRAIPALVEALGMGEDATIRRFAADSLALLGADARSASEALRHAAWHDEDPSVREAAAAALDAVEEPRLAP